MLRAMSDAKDVYIIFCTVPDRDTGQRIAAHLLEYRLAACVNIVAGLVSVYRWQGEVQTDQEALMIIKATAGDYPALETALRKQHPYELPEILAVPVAEGLPPYLDWVKTKQEAT